MTILLRQSNILDIPADVLICSANVCLNLTGGVGADIVELNPHLTDGEGADETVDLGLQIITSFMGKSII